MCKVQGRTILEEYGFYHFLTSVPRTFGDYCRLLILISIIIIVHLMLLAIFLIDYKSLRHTMFLFFEINITIKIKSSYV